MITYLLKKEDLLSFYSRIAQDYDLFVPLEIKSKPKVKCDFNFSADSQDYFLKAYAHIENKEEIAFNNYRCVEPLKMFFVPAKEELARLFNENKNESAYRPVAVCGVKNCDLFSLKIQDFVFLGGDFADPSYQARRQEALIIASDCLSFKEVCFCRAFDINPHASQGFDFNLSRIDTGFLLDVASPKAEKIITSINHILTLASQEEIAVRAQKRQAFVDALGEHLAAHKIPKKETLKDIVVSGYNSQVWNEQMQTCVECGGCVFICDTCHCFLLSDDKLAFDSQRVRVWDGCLYKNFSRVAGGANPLKMRYMRLRNRYLKKFDFFIDNIGFQACCGCGRCIEVCPGKIDIRYILKRLYDEKYLSAH
jgi:sulfhydrogenase subunit beta (sulfur reductase)